MAFDTANTERQLQATLNAAYRSRSPLRTLWALFAGRRWQLALTVTLYIIKQSPVWAFPIVTGNIISWVTAVYSAHQAHRPIDPLATRHILLNALVMLLLIAQNIPMHTLYAMAQSSVVRNVQLVLRSSLVMRLQQLSMSFHDRAESGKLQSKVLRDVEAVETLSRLMIESLLQGAIVLAVAMVMTLRKSPTITVFFLLTVPVAVVLTRVFSKPMKRRNEQFRLELEDMSSRVSEMIEMIPITRAHAVEGVEVDKLHRQLLRIRRSGHKLDFSNNLFGSTAWATFQSFQLLCLLFNIYQCYQGAISVGDVVMYQGFFAMVVGAVQQMVNMIPQLTTGTESLRSIGEVLESPDVEHNEGKTDVGAVRGDLDFQHLGYRYDDTRGPAALRDINLHIKAGQCVAFVGASGSGKTTLMSIVMGFRRPTNGRLLLDGIDTSGINFRTFRRHLAVVPQQTVLFNGTVRENITYGLSNITQARLDEVLEMARCAEFISALPTGLETQIGTRGGRLSGGQRQRVAIARALLRDPRVIILDEATSSLDLHSEKLVQEAIERLIVGRTTLIVAHRLSTVRHANRIVVMNEGAIVETGGHAELLSQAGSAFSRLHALRT